MAREVARYNQAQQNAQALSVPLAQSVLYRAKSEILQCTEMLIEKLQALVAKLLIEVTEIILHCIDLHELKNKGLHEICPTLCKYNQISHCQVTRRIAAGAANGYLAVYELRQSKCQMIPAHSHRLPHWHLVRMENIWLVIHVKKIVCHFGKQVQVNLSSN